MLKSMQEVLEDGFKVLNRVYFNNELPPVVISIMSSPRTNGHFTIGKVWRAEENHFNEISQAHVYGMEAGLADIGGQILYIDENGYIFWEDKTTPVSWDEMDSLMGDSGTVPSINMVSPETSPRSKSVLDISARIRLEQGAK